MLASLWGLDRHKTWFGLNNGSIDGVKYFSASDKCPPHKLPLHGVPQCLSIAHLEMGKVWNFTGAIPSPARYPDKHPLNV